jgi:hypothetical protein
MPSVKYRSTPLILTLLLIAFAAAPRAQAQAPQLPSTVYIWPMANAYESFPSVAPPSFSQNIMMASLAGIVNRSTNGEVLLSPNDGTQPNPRYWLDQLKLSYPQVQSQVQSNPGFYIDKYKSKLTGYVLFDPANPVSVNVATSIAGVTDAIIVSDSKASGIQPKSTKDLAIAKGLTQIADARNMTYAQTYAQYGNLFNKDMLFHQFTYQDFQLRDYAVMNRGFTYFTDPVALNPGPAPTQSYAANQNPQGRIFGWANNEFDLFNQASQSNQQVVASNHNWSSSTTAKWKVPTVQQKSHPTGVIVTKPGKTYVSFVMSDGDNATWLTNGMGTDPKYFGSPNRGKFSMNWDFTPTLADMNPVAFNFFYKNANDGTAPGKPGTDTFVAAGGSGLAFPSQTPDTAAMAASIGQSMAAADLKVTSILDNVYDINKLGPIVDQEQVLGMMYKTYDTYYKGRNGAIAWRNGKPIVSVKYSLWDGADSAQSLINILNNTAPKDPIDNSASYVIVNVHPWSTRGPDGTAGSTGDPMSNLWTLVQGLDASKVEVVGLEEMMIQLRNRFGTPLPGAVIVGTWTRDANSNWGITRTNWTGAMPNFINATVNFGSAITATRNVEVRANSTAGTINFDNSNLYNLFGASTVTMDTTTGPARINVLSGSHNLNAPVVLADDTTITVTPAASTLTMNALQPTLKNITKAGAGAILVNNVRAGALNIDAGKVRLASNGQASGVSRLTSLTMASGASINLADNKLIVAGGDAGTLVGSTYTGVSGMIQRGFDNGAWDGAGMVTSMSAAKTFLTTLAVATADETGFAGGTWGGQAVTSGDVLVMYTYLGDANLSGAIDADDYALIDLYSQIAGSSSYNHGDFNYDGSINADDYALIDSNVLKQGAAFPTFSSSAAMQSLTAVPEPTLGLLAIAALPLMRRRNRAT